MRVCPVCNKMFGDDEFTISKTTNQPIGKCKNCKQQYQKEYDKKRAEQRREYAKDYYYNKGGREKRIENYAKIPQEVKDNINKQRRLERLSWSEEKLENSRKQCRTYYKNNREQICEKSQKYKLETNYNKKYYENNREEILNKRRENYKLNIPNFKISNMIYKNLKEANLNSNFETLVPYTLQQLKEHLESQFTPEMSWGNYGSYWEIDHIIPKNLFNITDEKCKDFQICWSLVNLRPLSISENRSRPKDGSDISEKLRQRILNQKL